MKKTTSFKHDHLSVSSSSSSSNDVGCLTIVGVVFVMLKLLAVEPVAHWPWIWVLCPFWIEGAFGALAFVLFIVFGLFALLFIRRE